MYNELRLKQLAREKQEKEQERKEHQERQIREALSLFFNTLQGDMDEFCKTALFLEENNLKIVKSDLKVNNSTFSGKLTLTLDINKTDRLEFKIGSEEVLLSLNREKYSFAWGPDNSVCCTDINKADILVKAINKLKAQLEKFKKEIYKI